MKNIVFVSNGNIGRSIIAQALFEQITKNENKSNEFQIDSCGVFAYNGQEPPLKTIKKMEEKNIRIEGYKSKSVYDSNINSMDLILCMTNVQKLQMQHRYPEKKSSVYTLKEYVIYDNDSNEDINIEEINEDDFDKCYKEINESLHKLIKIVE